MENIEEISILLDFYGNMLSEKQREFLRLYHEENCSMPEIAAEYGVSRQSVFDAVNKAEKALRSYEEKLGLYARFRRTSDQLSLIESEITKLIEENSGNTELVSRLSLIREKAELLED